MKKLTCFIFCFLISLSSCDTSCEVTTGDPGVCVLRADCPWIDQKGITRSNICGYNGNSVLVCCPTHVRKKPEVTSQSQGEESCVVSTGEAGVCTDRPSCLWLDIQGITRSNICRYQGDSVKVCCPRHLTTGPTIEQNEPSKVQSLSLQQEEEACVVSTGDAGVCTDRQSCPWLDRQGITRSNICRYEGGSVRVCCPRHQSAAPTVETIEPSKVQSLSLQPENCKVYTGETGVCVKREECPWDSKEGLGRGNICKYEGNTAFFCCPSQSISSLSIDNSLSHGKKQPCDGSSGYDGVCVDKNQCPWLYQEGIARENICGYPEGILHLCCPKNQTDGVETEIEDGDADIGSECKGIGFTGVCVLENSCARIQTEAQNICGVSEGLRTVCCPFNRATMGKPEQPVGLIASAKEVCTGSTGYSGVCVYREECPYLDEHGIARSNICNHKGTKTTFCCPSKKNAEPLSLTDVTICTGTNDGKGYCVVNENCIGAPETVKSEACDFDVQQGKVYKCCPDQYAYHKNEKLPEIGTVYPYAQDTVTNEICDMKLNRKGYCVNPGNCRSLDTNVQPVSCGFVNSMVHVCCPAENAFDGATKLPPIATTPRPVETFTPEPIGNDRNICDMEPNKKGICVKPQDCPRFTSNPRLKTCGFINGMIHVCCPSSPPTTRVPVTATTLPPLPKFSKEELVKIWTSATCFNAPNNQDGYCNIASLCPHYPAVNKSNSHFCGFTRDQQPQETQYCCPRPTNLPSPYENELKMISKLEGICGYGSGARLSNAGQAPPGSWPWVAALFYGPRKRFKCAGSLISEKFVLTAGHCVVEDTRLSEIRLGDWNIREEIDCQAGRCLPEPQIFTPKRIITHPKYRRSKTPKNDVALIELDEYVKLTDVVSPVCLDDGSSKREEKIATVVGWGRTERSSSSDTLQRLDLPIVRTSECLAIWWGWNVTFSTSEHMCAGGIKGQDSCKGDSGGPLVIPKESKQRQGGLGRFVQVGVVSFGLNSCGRGLQTLPSVYADLQRYFVWIITEITKVEKLFV